MKVEYIEYDTAKLAKEKKFDWEVNLGFTEYHDENRHPEDGTSGPFGWEKGEIEPYSGYFVNFSPSDYSGESYSCYAVPPQSLLQRWLREVHKICVEATLLIDGSYSYSVYKLEQDGNYCKQLVFEYTDQKEYEIALEQGLIYGLNLIKIK